jgi:biotin operon repressor
VYRFNHHVWEIRDLTVYERIVLLYLLDRANEHGVCWPSLSTISRATGVSRKQVYRVLQSLRARGLLDWEHVGEEGWRHNSYRLNLEAIARGSDSGKKTRIEGASSEGRGLGGSVHQSLGRDYQSLGRDYQSLGRDYQSLGRDYQTPGWGLPDTGVGTGSPTNHPYNHPNKDLESLEIHGGELHNVALGQEEEGGSKTMATEEDPQDPRPSSPGSSVSPKEESPVAREVAHKPAPEDPLAPLGPAAPLVRRIMGRAPGKAALILERAKTMADLYGAEVLELLWRHAVATADHSPLGAWLRYADPTVPLPPEVRQALKGGTSGRGQGEATPGAGKPVPNRASIAYPGYLVTHSSDDVNPLEALAAGRMRLDEEGLAKRMPWLLEWAKVREGNPGLVSKIIRLHRWLLSYGPQDFANGLTPEIIITPEELLEAFEGDEPFLPPQDWWRGVEAEAKRLWRERMGTREVA